MNALRWSALLLAIVVCPALAALGEPADGPSPEELEREIEHLRESRDEARRRIAELEASVQTLNARFDGLERTAPVAQEPGEGPGRVGTTKERVAQNQAERDILERYGGVLLPAGQLVVEPGFQYTNFGRNRIELTGFSVLPAILIGRLDSVEIDRDIYQVGVTARYGLTDWLQFETTIPYLFRDDQEVFGATGAERERKISTNGFGDIDVALLAHAIPESLDGWVPDTILSVQARIPSASTDPYDVRFDSNGLPDDLPLGVGHWGLTVGTTMVKSLDPAVFFGSVRYQWNLEESTRFGDVDPGDGFEYALGTAFAINERSALNFTFQHRFYDYTTVNGQKVLRTDLNDARFFVGMSHTINETLTPNLSIGIGLTEDAPDVSVLLSFPLRMPWRLPALRLPSWRRGERVTLIPRPEAEPAGGA